VVTDVLNEYFLNDRIVRFMWMFSMCVSSRQY